jgi:hypothetical protein
MQANLTVNLGAGMQDTLGMVSEARKMTAILLALQLLCMFAFLAVVNLQSIIIAAHNSKLPGIVKVNGSHVRSRFVRFEPLDGI